MMADVDLSVLHASVNMASKTGENGTSKCLCCKKLKPELHKAHLEISSYEEIIKLLNEERKEELPTYTTPRNMWRKELENSNTGGPGITSE